MRVTVLLCLASGLSQILANIPVEYKVTLSCDTSSSNYTGCLRGMLCTDEKTCSKPLVDDDFPEPHHPKDGTKTSLSEPPSSTCVLHRWQMRP